MKPTLMTTLLTALLSALLCGCVASQNPYGPESEAVSDPRLVGGWQREGERGSFEFMHIWPRPDGKTLEIVGVNNSEKVWAVLSAHVNADGDRRYASLRMSDSSAEISADLQKEPRYGTHPYSIVAIRFDGDDRLLVAYPVEQLHAAVKAGNLAGETSGDYDVFISDTSAKIAAALAKVSDADLFKEPLAYRRIAPPHAP